MKHAASAALKSELESYRRLAPVLGGEFNFNTRFLVVRDFRVIQKSEGNIAESSSVATAGLSEIADNALVGRSPD